jgi:hypothetical protein
MRIIALGLVVIAISFVEIRAQTETRLNQCPAAFRTFYIGFKTAVRKADKTKVASMTKFPLRWGLDAGDEGEYTRDEFIKNFSGLFGADTADFMQERNPLCTRHADGTVVITSEYALHLNFAKSGKTYKLAAFVVEP